MKKNRGHRAAALAWLALLILGCGLSATPGAATPTAEVTILPYASPTGDAASQTATTAAATAAPAGPVTAKALGDINLRAGPALTYAILGHLTANQTVTVSGWSEDNTWYQVEWADAPDGHAWLFGELVSVEGDTGALPIVTVSTAAAPAATASSAPPTDTEEASAPGATPFGCQAPDDDYTIVSVGDGMVVNRRTYTMLAYAQTLYAGKHNFLKAITQGSYNPGVAASFGTHDGGGAVDISVRDVNTFAVLTDQLPAIVLALREAGFAAWVREADELSQGSPIHIHMIAVGDKEMSTAARRQIDGKEGYFRGYNGLPVDPPVADKWGPPILCPWMVELGYSDLRITP